MNDSHEMESAEQEFWATVVQTAGNYGGKSPVMHWLAVIAKLKAIEVYQRRKKLPCQAEDWGIDFLSTVNNDAIAWSRLASSDDVMEREEKEESARWLVWYLERSEDRTTQLILLRFIDGASYEHLAAEEHTTCSNMRILVSRAIASMRQTLIDVYQGV